MSWQKLEPTRHRVAVAGRVTDAETGKPVRGARVEITTAPTELSDWLALYARQFGDRWAAMTERPDRTRSAADGHFHFLDLPAGDYAFTASLPAAGSRYGTATSPTVTLSLDSLGNPVLATADLALPPTTVKGRLTQLDSLATGVTMAEVRIEGSGERTFSDGEGNYLLSGLEKGTRTVRISARGLKEPPPQTVDLAAAGAVVTLDLELEPL